MGFFSWKLADKPEQTIFNQHCDQGPTPCIMLLPDGTQYLELEYDGYGDFGGHDFYSEVSLLNGGDGDRMHGIDLMQVNKFECAPPGIKAPKLVSVECSRPYADLPNNKTCPTQGYFG